MTGYDFLDESDEKTYLTRIRTLSNRYGDAKFQILNQKYQNLSLRERNFNLYQKNLKLQEQVSELTREKAAILNYLKSVMKDSTQKHQK